MADARCCASASTAWRRIASVTRWWAKTPWLAKKAGHDRVGAGDRAVRVPVHEPIVQIGGHDAQLRSAARRRPIARVRRHESAGVAVGRAAIGYCCSVSSLMKVDFPAPFGPRIAVCSPAAIVSVRPSRTRAPPSTTVASQSSSSGSAGHAATRRPPAIPARGRDRGSPTGRSSPAGTWRRSRAPSSLPPPAR